MFTPPRMMRSFLRPVRRRDQAAPGAAAFHAALFAEIAGVVAGKSADLDLSDLAGGQGPTVGVDDREAVIGERTPDGAQAPLLARKGRDPPCSAGAVPLRNGDAEPVFEPSPFLDRERRRA